MVKSAVRAMDCLQELLASDAGGTVKIYDATPLPEMP
jgi:hypothetical protein